MQNSSTASSNVIPFDFHGQGVRATTIDGEPWFVASDVCRILSIVNTTQAVQALDDDERSMFNIGPQGPVNIINESGLYTLILRNRDAVKKGSKPHAFRRWVTSEVLPSIRKHGRFEDASRKMPAMLDGLIGVSEMTAFKGLIRQKVSFLPSEHQRSAGARLYSAVHTRFNVARTELIQHQDFSDACNFVAAYAIEGEYIPHAADLIPKLGARDRFMVSADARGIQKIEPIPHDAYVLTLEELIRGMFLDCDIPISTEAMFSILSAATENLKGRALHQAHAIKQAKRSAA